MSPKIPHNHHCSYAGLIHFIGHVVLILIIWPCLLAIAPLLTKSLDAIAPYIVIQPSFDVFPIVFDDATSPSASVSVWSSYQRSSQFCLSSFS